VAELTWVDGNRTVFTGEEACNLLLSGIESSGWGPGHQPQDPRKLMEVLANSVVALLMLEQDRAREANS
jgi:hypothetical protein